MTWIVAAAIVAFAGFRLWGQWRRRGERTVWWWVGWIAPLAAVAALPLYVLHGPGGADAPDALQIRKVLALVVMPAGLLWVAMGVGTGICLARRKWWAGVGMAGLFVLYGVAGNVWVGHWLLASLEDEVPAAQPAAVAAAGPFDIVCVLGGGTAADRDGAPEAGRAGDRVLLAAQMFQQGKCRFLGCSGATIPGMNQPRSLAEDTAAIWRGLGIPDEAIVRVAGEPRVTGTEVAAIQAECQRRAFTRVGLLSSGWHLPRTLAHCRRLGFTVAPIAADRVGPAPGFSVVWVIPQGVGFEDVQLGLWERLGRALGQ
jgi:uncharacterized SAM-binding protein YcdF (DUF218 family)